MAKRFSESFTHKNKNQVIVSKKFLHEGEYILIIDDFLVNGCALQGLISIVESAGAIVEGCGIVIEKGFQIGGVSSGIRATTWSPWPSSMPWMPRPAPLPSGIKSFGKGLRQRSASCKAAFLICAHWDCSA